MGIRDWKIDVSTSPMRVDGPDVYQYNNFNDEVVKAYAAITKTMPDAALADTLLFSDTDRARYAELAPPKFKVGDRVLVTCNSRKREPGVITEHDSRPFRTSAPFTVKMTAGGEFYFDVGSLSLDIERPFQVGDRVRVKETWRYVSARNKIGVIESIDGHLDYPIRLRIGEHHDDWGRIGPEHLELVPSEPAKWEQDQKHELLRQMTEQYESDLRAISDCMPNIPLYCVSPRHPVGTGVTVSIPGDSKLAPFHGRQGVVASVDADGTHHVIVEGFERDTYRFDADELKAVAPKVAAKPSNQQPREPSLISWATEDGCNKIEPFSRGNRVRELARQLFASNPSVLSFVERVGDFSVRSIESRNVRIISDARYQNAIRTAWNRNEAGLRTACIDQAMRIVDERGGK